MRTQNPWLLVAITNHTIFSVGDWTLRSKRVRKLISIVPLYIQHLIWPLKLLAPYILPHTIFSFFYFLLFSITVVCLFSPSLHPTPAKSTSLPHLRPPPWFGPCVLYSSSCNPFFPLPSPRAIVRLFLTSMSLVIFCLLFSSIYYVPVKGEIIWYLSLTTWFISLRILLSSNIPAVAKGISSFFLSAA